MTEEMKEPPYSNRGVLNTSQSTLRACVDWVQVTLKYVPTLKKIYEILGMEKDDFNEMSRSQYGYKRHLACGHISIFYEGSDNMGFHIQMTGQGCREYERYNTHNWQQFISKCLEYNGSFSRFDGAIDNICYGNAPLYFSPDKLYRKVKEGCCQSKFKKGKKVESFLVDNGENLGETLYFGREQSDMQIRIYEKDLERVADGQELEENLTGWVRTELQCRRDRAQALALLIVNDPDKIGDILAGVLKNYLNFLVKNPNESNKSRWKVCTWWSKFLGDVEPLRLTFIAPDKTIERAKSWIEKSVAPSLGMLFYGSGSNMDWMVELLSDGMDRMTPEQLYLAEENITKLHMAKVELDQRRNDKFQERMFKTVNTNHYINKEAHQSQGSMDLM